MAGLATSQPVTSAARSTTGNSGSVVIGRMDIGKLALLVNVTAASGTTPTLDLSVQWSADGTTFFAAQPADAFTQITTTGGAAKVFDVKAAFYRLLWTIGGTTPSFTFTVDAALY